MGRRGYPAEFRRRVVDLVEAGRKGARSAGIDGIAPRSIGSDAGEFLSGLREDLRARRFTPVRVREAMIPKANGKLRRLGIPTAADRVVQAS